jgi:hypothetical protein
MWLQHYSRLPFPSKCKCRCRGCRVFVTYLHNGLVVEVVAESGNLVCIQLVGLVRIIPPPQQQPRTSIPLVAACVTLQSQKQVVLVAVHRPVDQHDWEVLQMLCIDQQPLLPEVCVSDHNRLFTCLNFESANSGATQTVHGILAHRFSSHSMKLAPYTVVAYFANVRACRSTAGSTCLCAPACEDSERRHETCSQVPTRKGCLHGRGAYKEGVPVRKGGSSTAVKQHRTCVDGRSRDGVQVRPQLGGNGGRGQKGAQVGARDLVRHLLRAGRLLVRGLAQHLVQRLRAAGAL